MKWFKKKVDYQFSNRYFEMIQNNFASKMNAITKDLSKKSLIALLLLFVSGAGIFFGSLLYSSFKMELSRQLEIIEISKTLPLKHDRQDKFIQSDSSAVINKIIKSNIKK